MFILYIELDPSKAMYTSLPANTIKDKVNKIYYSKSDAKGTELTAAIMRAAHSCKSEKVFFSLSFYNLVNLLASYFS